MEFFLHTHEVERFSGDARYTFNDSGFLVVYTTDGRRRTYSPAAWCYVEDVSEVEGSEGGTGVMDDA